MGLVASWDDGQTGAELEHCWDLWVCRDCGRVAKRDVWADAGETWIGLSGPESAKSPKSGKCAQ